MAAISEAQLTFTLVALIFGGIGALFFGIGIVQFRNERAFARAALAAPGTVVGFERRRSASRRGGRRRVAHVDHAVVEFITQAGQPARFVSPVGTSPRLHREGQRITVLYNEVNPDDARIADNRMQFFLPIIFLIVGGVLLAFAILPGLIARLALAN